MTLQEIRDAFVLEHKLESQKRKVETLDINDGVIALWISEAQQDIQERIRPALTYTDVTLVSGTYLYDLPADFGRVQRGEIAGEEVDITSISDIITTGTIPAGNLTRFAVYYNGTKYQLRTDPNTTGTLRIWYYPETLFYSPSDLTQDWGTFTGGAFSGGLKIPTKFSLAVRYYLMSKIFDDFIQKYEKEISKLKTTRSDTLPESKYSFGGI